jgi:hypothetical protein
MGASVGLLLGAVIGSQVPKDIDVPRTGYFFIDASVLIINIVSGWAGILSGALSGCVAGGLIGGVAGTIPKTIILHKDIGNYQKLKQKFGKRAKTKYYVSETI